MDFGDCDEMRWGVENSFWVSISVDVEKEKGGRGSSEGSNVICKGRNGFTRRSD